ncbi:hypothetical protein ACOACQ_13545 [Nocardioides sp. CPCC 206347]|uniref:hypothetical protein n=1 Tax=unclassified Nocardioides TaxID=2615069 RepID=UPI003612F7C1
MTTPTRRRFFGGITPLSLALLVVVLLMGSTGGAVAGALITGKQIKDGTVSTIDVTNESLTGTDVRNETLTGADIRNDSVSASDIVDDPRLWGAVMNEAYGFSAFDIPVATTFSSRKGFVQITATIDAADDKNVAGFDTLLFTLFIDGKQIDVVHGLTFASEGDSGNGVITVIVPVAAGSHTVELLTAQESDPEVVGEIAFDMSAAELSVAYTAIGTTSASVLAPRPVHGRIAR